MKLTNSILILLAFCASCNLKESNNQNSGKNSVQIESLKTEHSGNTALMVDTLTDDGFIARVLANDLTLSHASSVYSSGSQSSTTSANLHNASINDTLVTLTAATDTLMFLKANGRVLATHANIETSAIIFDSTIQVGVAKSILSSKFSLSSIPDTFIVSDIEGGNTFTFIFSSGVLSKIKYQVAFVE